MGNDDSTLANSGELTDMLLTKIPQTSLKNSLGIFSGNSSFEDYGCNI
jgi:hypothetical protein